MRCDERGMLDLENVSIGVRMKVYNDFLWSRGLCLCEKDTNDVAPTTVGYRCQRYIISKELAMYMYRR